MSENFDLIQRELLFFAGHSQSVIPVMQSQMTHLRSDDIVLHLQAVVLHHSVGKLAWIIYSHLAIQKMP